MSISLDERSRKNTLLVEKIVEERLTDFYECTIHNMYYSVYQKMKSVLSQDNRNTNIRIPHRHMVNKCKDYIINDSPDTDVFILNRVRDLYRARIRYDYKNNNDVNYIDDKQYYDYYDIMIKANNFLDSYVHRGDNNE